MLSKEELEQMIKEKKTFQDQIKQELIGVAYQIAILEELLKKFNEEK